MDHVDRFKTRPGLTPSTSKTRYVPLLLYTCRYAGMLSIVKCGGPQIEFQPGRPDATVADAPARLPAAIEPLIHTISYFWVNGVTNFGK